MKQQLLILPGWEGTRKTWQNFIDIAKDDFDVSCLDLPCFGEEPCPDNIWGVPEYASFVEQKIKKLNLNKPILLGHSFGGQIAFYMTTCNPDLFSRLILSGPAILRQTSSFKKIIFKILAETGKMFFSLPLLSSYRQVTKKTLYYLANSDFNDTYGIKRDIYKKIINQDFSHLAEQIKVPTLIIWGDRDSHVPLANGKKIAYLIPGAKLKIIKNAGHGLHLKNTRQFYSLIKEFAKQ